MGARASRCLCEKAAVGRQLNAPAPSEAQASSERPAEQEQSRPVGRSDAVVVDTGAVTAVVPQQEDVTSRNSSKRVALHVEHDFTSARFDNVFIGISGPIGSGKSGLAKALGEQLKAPVFHEPPIDNVYLEDFYKDMDTYAFPLQIFLLKERFKQQQQYIWQGEGGVMDRTIYEDGVFARMLRDSGHMTERDYGTYMELFRNMSNFMKKPNVIVYLDVTPAESLRIIRARARPCENNITLAYLESLHKAYESFVNDIAGVIPVIKVDYQRFRTTEEMAKVIVKEYQEIASVRNASGYQVFSDCFNTPEKAKKTREFDSPKAFAPV